MLCSFIGDGAPLLGAIFESSYLVLSCGRFGRLVTLSDLIHNLIVIIHRVGLDLGLASFAFGYKTS